MKIGLQIPYFTWKGGAPEMGATFGDIAQRADAAGFASLWVMDHFFQLPMLGPAEADMLEAYTALGFAAARTSKIKLGTLVTGVTYRHPGVLVKAATTLDVLSGGRAYLGIGAAWFDREHAGLGVTFPPMKERFERLEEALQIARQMWSDDNGAFAGKHYQLAETICTPRPLSQPHMPILIGGRGEKKTLRLVAKYGDAWNMPGGFDQASLDEFRRLSTALREHCAREGRSYDEIKKTTLGTLMMRESGADPWRSPEAALDLLREYHEAGVDELIFNMPFVDDPRTIELVAEKIIAPAASW